MTKGCLDPMTIRQSVTQMRADTSSSVITGSRTLLLVLSHAIMIVPLPETLMSRYIYVMLRLRLNPSTDDIMLQEHTKSVYCHSINVHPAVPVQWQQLTSSWANTASLMTSTWGHLPTPH